MKLETHPSTFVNDWRQVKSLLWCCNQLFKLRCKGKSYC